MLTTERLALRPFTREDNAAFRALAGDLAVARMTSDIPHPVSEAQADHWLSPVAGEQRFALWHDGSLIGGAGTFLRDGGTGELGFWLGRDFWGRGFATEAARAVLAHAVAHAGYSAFSSSHFLDNLASRRVLEKLGFEPAGTGRIWSVARASAVEAQWVWLSLEKARALHGDPSAAVTPPRSRWRTLADRIVRLN